MTYYKQPTPPEHAKAGDVWEQTDEEVLIVEDEKLKQWLDECDEWVAATDLKPDAIKFLQARLKRACAELRERIP